jgi:hypothetical protein
MALRDRLRRLEKTMRGRLSSFELADGTTFYFEPEEQSKAMFLYFADSMTADYKRKPRPEPPELLKAVANAKDRSEVLSHVMNGYSHLPLDREALIECGEFKPRSLVAGRSYEDLGIQDEPGE